MDVVPVSVGQINQSGVRMGKFTKSQDNVQMKGRYF